MGKNSERFLRNFSKLSLKTVIPQKSLILGTNSAEFLENFLGISYRKWFSRNSSEILQRKSPRLENLGKFLIFVTWETNISSYLKVVHRKNVCALVSNESYSFSLQYCILWSNMLLSWSYFKRIYFLKKIVKISMQIKC